MIGKEEHLETMELFLPYSLLLNGEERFNENREDALVLTKIFEKAHMLDMYIKRKLRDLGIIITLLGIILLLSEVFLYIYGTANMSDIINIIILAIILIITGIATILVTYLLAPKKRVTLLTKLYKEFDTMPYDSEKLFICDTRKSGERFGIVSIDIKNLEILKTKITPEIKTLDNENIFVQDLGNARDAVNAIDVENHSSPFIRGKTDMKLKEDLLDIFFKSTELSKRVNKIPGKDNEKFNVEDIIQKLYKFSLEYNEYTQFIECFEKDIDNLSNTGIHSINTHFNIDHTAKSITYNDSKPNLSYTYPFDTTYEHSINTVFDVTLAYLKNEVQPEIDKVISERESNKNKTETYFDGEITKTKAEYDRQISDLERDRDKELSRLDGQIENAHSEYVSYTERYNDLTDRYNSLNSEIKSLDRQASRYTGSYYDEYEIEQANRNISRIESEMDRLRSQQSNLEIQLNEYESKRNSAHSEYENLTSQRINTKDRYDNLIYSKRSEKKHTIQSLKSEKEQKISTIIKNAEAEIDRIKAHIYIIEKDKDNIQINIIPPTKIITGEIESVISLDKPEYNRKILNVRNNAIRTLNMNIVNQLDNIQEICSDTYNKIGDYSVFGTIKGSREYYIPVYFGEYNYKGKMMPFKIVIGDVRQNNNKTHLRFSINHRYKPLYKYTTIDNEIKEVSEKESMLKNPNFISNMRDELKNMRDEKILSKTFYREMDRDLKERLNKLKGTTSYS